MNVDRAQTGQLGRGDTITFPLGPEKQDRPGEGETQPHELASPIGLPEITYNCCFPHRLLGLLLWVLKSIFKILNNCYAYFRDKRTERKPENLYGAWAQESRWCYRQMRT